MADPKHLRNARIIVIEDDPRAAEAIREHLERQGATVVGTVPSGAAGANACALAPAGESTEVARVFDSVIDLLCLTDHDGNVHCLNAEWTRLFGYTIDDFDGRQLVDFVHPDDREETIHALATAANRFLNRYRTTTGAYRWLEWRIVPHGELLYASARDVTSLQSAQEQLRDTESRYRAVVDDQTEFIVRWTPDGTRTFVNEAYARYFGQRTRELIGTSFMPLIKSEDDRAAVRQRLESLTPASPIMVNQHRALRADGQLRWQEWIDRGFFDTHGQLVELQSVGRDVHDRVVAEQALGAQRNLLEIMVRDTPAAVAMFDTDMRYLAWSNRWLTDYRIDERDISGVSHYEVFPEISDEWKAIHRRCLDGHIERREDDAFPRIDGRLDYVRWVCQPWYKGGDTREIGGIILFTEVITERKRAEAALRRSEEERRRLEEQVMQSQKLEAIGRLSAGVAHDFNNLLTVVNGYSDLLLADQRLDAYSRELVGEIGAAGQRASRLTAQLLAFSRQQVMRAEAVDLESMVGNISSMLARLIGEDVELVTHTTPGLRRITADPGQIEQVLVNLSVNARDAMPDGGTLTIECRNVDVRGGDPLADVVRPGSWVRMEFRDTGTGMDAATLEHCFEPFFTTKEHGLGTGLGLATVYGIVQQSGGVIRVSSNVGKGSAFEIFFPAAAQSSRRTPIHTDTRELRGTEGILVVEDDESVRTMIVTALRRYGYRVHAAESPADALRYLPLLNGDIQLLVTDVVMPGMNGRELAESIRLLRPEVHVLFMSGYNDDAVLRRGIVHGEVDILSKPFTPQELARRVRSALSRARTA